jgi:hypothetical protein
MVGWRGWAAGVVALGVFACGGSGGSSINRQSGTGEAGTGGGAVDSGQPPGSDDGGSVTDSGTGGPGGSDAGGAGVDGGSSDAGTGGPGADAGSPDAGTGGPGDGGPGDGGTACGTPGPADVCQQLNPRLGAPVVHQEMENPDPFDGVACGAGAYPSSGTGVVLHPMQPTGKPPRLDFVDRTGTQIGTDTDFSIATIEIDVIPQATGFGIFDPYIGGIGSYPLMLLDDHGKQRGSASGFYVFELPAAGVGVFSFSDDAPGCGQQTGIYVQRFEEDGSPALADRTDLGCYPQTPDFVMAGNGSGSVLALSSQLTATGWDGIWLDAQLRVVGRFNAPELNAVSSKAVAVAALLDGSFVLRFDGKWLYRIQPGASAVEPAPCWLTARPGTDIHVTRDRNAYALVQPGARSCDAAIELMTPLGESCGPVGPLESGSDTCDVAIGRDGTISGSAYAVDAGAGQPAACVLQFWPAALGGTDL